MLPSRLISWRELELSLTTQGAELVQSQFAAFLSGKRNRRPVNKNVSLIWVKISLYTLCSVFFFFPCYVRMFCLFLLFEGFVRTSAIFVLVSVMNLLDGLQRMFYSLCVCSMCPAWEIVPSVRSRAAMEIMRHSANEFPRTSQLTQ